MNSIIISPSILAGNLLNIQSEIEYLNKIENIWLHLDVMDGHFVPNLTFGPEIISRISKLAKMPLDMHLMVNNPIFHLEVTKTYSIHHVTVHWEAITHNWREVIAIAKTSFKSVGLSIKPKTNIEDVPLELLSEIDLLLVMSVEPGFYGQKYIENSTDKVSKIAQLRLKNKFKYSIQVDGGISTINIQGLIKAGANNFVAGNSVFKNGYDSYKNAVNELRNINV